MQILLTDNWVDPVTGVYYSGGTIVVVSEVMGAYLVATDQGAAYKNPDPPYVEDEKYRWEKWRRLYGGNCGSCGSGGPSTQTIVNDSVLTEQNEVQMYNAVLDIDTEEVTAEPVTLAEVKSYAVIDFTSSDAELTAFITTAREQLEEYTNINFVSRTVTALITNNAGGQLLPRGPIYADIPGSPPDTGAGAINIAITDQDGNVMEGSSIKVTGIKFFNLVSPVGENLTVQYTGGYKEGELPEQFKTAIKAQVLWLNEHKGDESEAVFNSISPVAKQAVNTLRKRTSEVFIY